MSHLSHRQVAFLLTGAVTALFVLLVLAFSFLRPMTPSAVTGARTVADCAMQNSNAAETLVPTPPAGEAIFAASGPSTQRIAVADDLPLAEPYSVRWRTGIGVPMGDPYFYRWPDPRPGWYLNWRADPVAADAERLGLEFTPMVRMSNNTLRPSIDEIHRLATQHRGQTWLIGNEPDVRWQDDASPEEYACYYHFAYQAIKSADPTAQVAIGGVSQVTPLRLAYLDRVLASYQGQFDSDMPVDIWNMHAFVLREEAGAWGVGLPPGFDDDSMGVRWEIDDHDKLILVENQVRLMRSWMAARGQRDKPLIISEYGILMPAEFGFDPFRTIQFMIGSFDLFQRLRDDELGYPADDNRLVQRWVWFSTWMDLYPTGNLFDENGEPLPPMRAMSGYLRSKE
ncbi:MAG: glycosyl hydrolase [Caldilineaceae bacterium]|nr:hypothetical protein [Caldilineaceae bacterium]